MKSGDDYYVCPECGDERFSWTITQVQFGPIDAYVNNDDEWVPMPIGDQMGDIIDSDDDPVMCQGCQEEIALDDLARIPRDSGTSPESDAFRPLERVEETGSGLIQ